MDENCKKPTSWERTEVRAVIKYGKRADKSPTKTWELKKPRKVHRKCWGVLCSTGIGQGRADINDDRKSGRHREETIGFDIKIGFFTKTTPSAHRS